MLAIDASRIGGGQVHLLALARGLAAAGLQPLVMVGEAGYLTGRLEAEGIPVEVRPLPRRPGPVSLVGLRRRIKEIGPSLVHTHGGVAGAWIRLACLGLAVPRVHTFHGIHYLHFAGRIRRVLHRGLDRFLAGSTARFIVVSPDDLEAGGRAGVLDPPRTRVILNGIDPTPFVGGPDRLEARRSLGLPEKAFLIGCRGRYHEQKGHRDLLEAFARFAGTCPAARLVLVGEGPLEDAIRRRCGRSDLAGKVRFLPPDGPAPEFYAALDLFVLPSLWEGLPLTLLEALAAACPAIATGVAGTRQVVHDGVEGLLVPAGDAAALARAMEELRADPDHARRLGLAGRERVLGTFTGDRMIAATLAVYREILGELAGRPGGPGS